LGLRCIEAVKEGADVSEAVSGEHGILAEPHIELPPRQMPENLADRASRSLVEDVVDRVVVEGFVLPIL
jgi:hypothetical protein